MAEDEISADRFAELAGIISESGAKEIDFLGGEPTLHPGIKDLIEIACKSGFRINLSSNGTNTRLLEDLASEFSGRLNIGISLNGPSISAGLHGFIINRKPLLKSICAKSFTLLDDAVNYLELPGIKYYLLYMDTVFRDDINESIPFFEFYKRLNAARSRHKNIEGVFCPGFLPDTAKYPFLRQVRCPAGTTKLSVMPDGAVYPCYLFFRHEEFRLGNLIENDFSEIWESAVLNYFRKFEGNKCPNRKCALFSACHGGCPAVSLLIYGDINAPDPRCINPATF